MGVPTTRYFSALEASEWIHRAHQRARWRYLERQGLLVRSMENNTLALEARDAELDGLHPLP